MSNNNNVTNVDVLSVGALYVGGKRFRDIIRSLIAEDTLEQGEIDTLRTLLANLNTDGLTSEWIVNNDNRNAVLKTLITAIETKLAKIDTTALTETSLLNNDNRNSVLKTRLDTAETDIDNLETRATTDETNITAIKKITNHFYYSVGNPDLNEPNNRHNLVLDMNNINPSNRAGDDVTQGKKLIAITAGGSLSGGLLMKYDPTGANAGDDIRLYTFTGSLLLQANTNVRLTATDDINIGLVKHPNNNYLPHHINIGGAMSRINIGSVETPKVGITPGDPDTGQTTEITIGKNTTFKNTKTKLAGNFYTSESRWEDLHVTDVVTIETAAAWSIGFVFTGVPYWLLWLGLSGVPNYRYSDIVKMANNYLTGGLTKNHSIETSNDISVKNMRVIDFTVVSLSTAFDAILARLVFQAFAVHGSHSIGSIWGRTNIYAGNGEIEIRVDGGAFEWAFKNAGNCNRVFLDNDHVEVVQCNGNGGTGRLRLVAANGNIELSTATGGVRANAKKVMEIKSNKQIVIGSDTTMTDDTYKMLIDTTSHSNGIKVAKGSDALLLNPDNVNSKSLTLQSGYTGTTVNTLFMNSDNKLMWNGTLLGSGGGGLEYYIPLANNVTNPAPSPTAQVATETYTSANQRTITQSTTAVNTGILMAKYATGIINKESNPLVEGLQTIQQHLTWNQNNIVGQIYGQSWFQASASGAGAFIYDRSFTGVTVTGGYQVLNGVPILAPQGLFNLTFQSVVFPGIDADSFSSATIQMKCRLEAQTNGTWATLQTSDGFKSYSQDTPNQTITFDETFTHNQTSKTNAPTAYRMVLFLTTPSANGQIYQRTFAGSTFNDLIAYKLGSTAGNTAEIRVLLYDGVNAKKTIAHTSTPILNPIELPISLPYQIGAFNNGRLGFDIYMFQPSGSVNANHQMTFYFGDGTISHIETTIKPPTNVKEITAGTNIGRSVTDGNYTITNTAPVQNVTGGAGISVEIDPITKLATITNTAMIQNVGVTQASVAQSLRDEHQALLEVGALPPKPDYWAKNFVIADNAVARSHFDIYVSVDGQIIASASPNVGSGGSIRHSKDYGTTWAHGSITNVIWSSICGTSQGSKLFAFGKLDSSTLLLCTSTNQGTTWTSVGVLPSAVFGGLSGVPLASITRFRCSGDGKYLIASDSTSSLNGRFFTSTTGGGSSAWTQRLLNSSSPGRTTGVCMSRSGAVQYIAWAGTSNSAVYASYDYGATFNSIQGNFSDGATWDRLECDATGRFLYATRYSVITATHRTWRNDNYGDAYSWTEITGFSGAEDIWVSATGQFVAVVTSPLSGGVSYVFYSSDYGRSWTGNVMGTSTTFRSMNGSADGSILVLGSVAAEEAGFPGTGFIRIAKQYSPNLIINQFVMAISSIDGYVYNGWGPSIVINWDFNNYEYDIQFDLQIETSNIPTHIFWAWALNVGSSNQYHHSWNDHDGISGGFLGAGQDTDNRVCYTYNTSNTHHNFNMTLKRVRCPNTSYNQRLLLECNCNQIMVGPNTANIASARMPFSRTNNYFFANSTDPNIFNGENSIIFYGRQNYCASSNSAYIRITKRQIT